MTRKRFFFDTEFIEDGKTIDLISIGCVSETYDRTYYACNNEARLDRADHWVKDNVIRHLPKLSDPTWKTREQIKLDLLTLWFDDPAFAQVKPIGGSPIELWAYFADYDWVVLCQLFGRMIDLPPAMPMFAMDVKMLARLMGDPQLPPQDSAEHHALNDAMWTRDAYHFLMSIKR